jgi:hypothetical protein
LASSKFEKMKETPEIKVFMQFGKLKESSPRIVDCRGWVWGCYVTAVVVG